MSAVSRTRSCARKKYNYFDSASIAALHMYLVAVPKYRDGIIGGKTNSQFSANTISRTSDEDNFILDILHRFGLDGMKNGA